jgi:hypothetical protein
MGLSIENFLCGTTPPQFLQGRRRQEESAAFLNVSLKLFLGSPSQELRHFFWFSAMFLADVLPTPFFGYDRLRGWNKKLRIPTGYHTQALTFQCAGQEVLFAGVKWISDEIPLRIFMISAIHGNLASEIAGIDHVRPHRIGRNVFKALEQHGHSPQGVGIVRIRSLQVRKSILI